MNVTTSKLSPRLVILLIIVWGLLTVRMAAPWYGVQDSFRVWIAAAVRNYDIYGADTLGFLMTRDSAPRDDPDDLRYYTHHPTSIVWFPAVVTQFTGYHELGMRYGFAVMALLSTALFYVVARRLAGERVAFWAMVIYGLVPMLSYMGRIPGYAQLSLFVAMLFAAVLINWLRQPTRARLMLLLLLSWIAVWTAWSAVFFVAMLGITAMLLGNRQQQLAVVAMGAVCVAAFFALMGYYEVVRPGSLGDITSAFSNRTSSDTGSGDATTFTLVDFLLTNLIHMMLLIMPGVLIMAVIGIRSARKHLTRQSNILLAVGIFGGGLTYLLLFRNGTYVHDYYKAFLVPGIAILAATAWVYIRMDPPKRRFMNPVMDGLLLSSIVIGLAIYGLLHYSGRQPEIQAVIDTINTQATQDDNVVVYFNYPGYEPRTGYNRVVEFYTNRSLAYWNTPPAEVMDLVAETDQRSLFIYCHNPNHDMIAAEQRAAEDFITLQSVVPSVEIVDERCWLFVLQPGPLSVMNQP